MTKRGGCPECGPDARDLGEPSQDRICANCRRAYRSTSARARRKRETVADQASPGVAALRRYCSVDDQGRALPRVAEPAPVVEDDERPTCPTCGPGESLEGQYMCDASEDRGEYDGWLCSRCRGYWTVAELDATSAYRQAYIDGDAIAERVREQAEASLPALDLFASGAKLIVLLDGLVRFAALADTMINAADARRGAAYCRRQACAGDESAVFYLAAADMLDRIAKGGDQ